MVGKTVYVSHRGFVDRFLCVQFHHQPLGVARYTPGQMEVGRGGVSSRQDEGLQRFKRFVQPIDFILKADNLFIAYTESTGTTCVAFRGAKVRPKVKQVILNPAKHLVGHAGGMESGHADDTVGLINRTVCGNPDGAFGNPLAGTQRRFAKVATARVNFREGYHCGGETDRNVIIAKTARATPCNTTRQRISLLALR